MYASAKAVFEQTLHEIDEAGLTKNERIITTPQSREIQSGGKPVLNFCANNYLGIADHPDIIQAAKDAMDTHGFGLSSVRFICGTQDIHKQLEKKIADFLGMEDSILYAACFDANGGLFETLLGKEDAVISDQLNHASIIDGVRLCKAQRFRYANSNMEELEQCLKDSQDARIRLITTDGVFSMDGYIAKLDEICDLADKYDALVHVDDCHATGFFGKTGRGSIEHRNVMGRVDIVTSTLGKAVGGASGGFTASRKEIVGLLRQRSRPYLFSNTVAPSIVGASLKAFEMLEDTSRRDRLEANTVHFRKGMEAAGLNVLPGSHPIVPVMIGEARIASEMADALLEEGIYVIGFSFPVVPKGQARIRVQVSAAHTTEDLDRAIAAFAKVAKDKGLLK